MRAPIIRCRAKVPRTKSQPPADLNAKRRSGRGPFSGQDF
jgi:hypothetical protein